MKEKYTCLGDRIFRPFVLVKEFDFVGDEFRSKLVKVLLGDHKVEYIEDNLINVISAESEHDRH